MDKLTRHAGPGRTSRQLRAARRRLGDPSAAAGGHMTARPAKGAGHHTLIANQTFVVLNIETTIVTLFSR
jgi:hypothetical protein